MHYFYIFRCKDGSLYCGSTKDLRIREKLHNSGKGAIYTRTHGGGHVVYTETYETIGQAMRREAAVKKWTRTKKLELVRTRKSNGRQSSKPQM